ncbi:MAG: 2-oxoglutarate dehydrogenase complex dihydrolipoyllysine-residue succinyltransferase [Isosphaeraceae bacterium]|nr:2-oxoglutarate dehydrogenase complex dihydrolipoyllysine-residue succinyltransferase [Isosphaeraceae bacterium]
MAVEIKVPNAGESITEGTVARWLKPDGAAVKQDEPVCEIETEKTLIEANAPASGILKIAVAEQTVVPIGAVIGTIDPSGSGAAPAAVPAPANHSSAPAAPQPSATTEPALAPAVRRLVAENSIDPASIEGTGRAGRITKGDVLEKMAQPSPAPAAPQMPLAAQAEPKPAAPPATEGRETRKRMTGIRQTIAARLVEAQQTAAILTTFNEADMSRIMEIRAKYKDAYQKKHGVGLGFMSFFVKAVVEALRAFPAVNGRIDGNELVFHNYYNIGVAVSTERGLMVPVLRDADQLSFAQIEKQIGVFATKAREGTISVNDLQGGTFTITNGGVFGSLLSTPILNPPQSGILGMHTIQKRPVAVDDQVVIRPMMYLAHSYDHRMIDGKEAVSFLVRIKECVENPERLMLEI